MLIVPAAPAVEIETSDPVAEAIPHIEARTGVVITTEWAPSMKLEKHPFTFDLPAPNAAAARELWPQVDDLEQRVLRAAHACSSTRWQRTQWPPRKCTAAGGGTRRSSARAARPPSTTSAASARRRGISGPPGRSSE